MEKDRENMNDEARAQAEQEEAAGEDSQLDLSQLDFSLATIENLRKERDENYDLLLRKQAEFENYRKRVAREKKELSLSARGAVIKELLHVVDAFEKGLNSLGQESSDSALETYRQGYELMLKEFWSVFDKFNVTEIAGSGACFDPNVHEAVVREVTTEHEEGEILDEYRKGYMIGNRLLRPAQVKVAVRPDELPVSEDQLGKTNE
jgi:molecular chaperone GrpE